MDVSDKIQRGSNKRGSLRNTAVKSKWNSKICSNNPQIHFPALPGPVGGGPPVIPPSWRGSFPWQEAVGSGAWLGLPAWLSRGRNGTGSIGCAQHPPRESPPQWFGCSTQGLKRGVIQPFLPVLQMGTLRPRVWEPVRRAQPESRIFHC